MDSWFFMDPESGSFKMIPLPGNIFSFVWWKNAVVFAPVQFILVKEQLVEFNQLAIEHANGHEDMLNRVMTKDNIALAALLHTREPCWENGIPPDPSQVR